MTLQIPAHLRIIGAAKIEKARKEFDKVVDGLSLFSRSSYVL
jgi:hypothetical protein